MIEVACSAGYSAAVSVPLQLDQRDWPILALDPKRFPGEEFATGTRERQSAQRAPLAFCLKCPELRGTKQVQIAGDGARSALRRESYTCCQVDGLISGDFLNPCCWLETTVSAPASEGRAISMPAHDSSFARRRLVRENPNHK